MTAFAEEMRRLITERGTSQADLARRAYIDPGRISRIANGKADPTPDLAATLDDLLDAGGQLQALATIDYMALLDGTGDTTTAPHVTADQQRWVRTRECISSHRTALVRAAATLYPGAQLEDTGLITAPGWVLDQPVPLDQVRVATRELPPPAVDGAGPEAAHVLPWRTVTSRYTRYTHAIRDLARPRLFANRHCWRLTGVHLDAPRPSMTFGDCLYFGGVDVQEAVAHELSLVGLDELGGPRPRLSLRDMPLRRAVGDPFDMTRRPTLAAVSTLTIRRAAGGCTFYLHRRDAKAVAQSGGSTQVIPSGIFQPSTLLPGACEADFDLWRNIMREYSEEMLGHDEHGGDGRPVDYTAEPLGPLDAAYADGRVRVWLLGVGMDALSLFGEVMTVAVWDADFFDEWAADLVADNDEGSLVIEPLPFAEAPVRAMLRSGRMLPAGAGCLELAWRHRATLLG